VDLNRLGAAVKLLSAEQLNMVDDSSKDTTLEIAMFCKNGLEASAVLIEAGADPVCQKPPRDFANTALGKAARYEECKAVIPVLCRAVKEEDWAKVVASLGVHKSHEVGSYMRVEHISKGKGTTSFNADKDKGPFGGSSESGDVIAVDFDTGGMSVVARSELKVLPQLYAQARDEVIKGAKKAGCSEEIMQALRDIEVGMWKPYGVA